MFFQYFLFVFLLNKNLLILDFNFWLQKTRKGVGFVGSISIKILSKPGRKSGRNFILIPTKHLLQCFVTVKSGKILKLIFEL